MRFAVLIFVVLLSPFSAQADQRVIIAEWRGDWVEIFMTMPTSDLIGTGMAAETGLMKANGRIDFASIRDIPANIGDEILGVLDITGTGNELSAMSMMAHGLSDPYAFTTPFEGMIASSVCGVPLAVELLPPEDTRIYLSAIADVDPSQRRLDLDLAQFAGPLRVIGWDGGEIVQDQVVSGDTTVVQIQRGSGGVGVGSALALVLAWAVVFLGIFIWRHRVARHGMPVSGQLLSLARSSSARSKMSS